MTMPAKREQQDFVDQKRWLAYAAAGAASALVCQGAEASIVHVTVNQALDSSGGPGSSSNSLAFAVGQASSASIFFSHLGTTSAGAAYFGASGSGAQIAGFSASAGSGVFPYALNLAAGQNVSTAGGFQSGSGTMAFGSFTGNSQFLAPGIGFVGFQFNGGSGAQYGWARVDMSGAAINSFTIVDYAYAGIGESIEAGETASTVPEPASLGLLAAGAAGLAISRRRRRQKPA